MNPNQPVELLVHGMHCSNCALGVEKHLQKIGGQKVSVNLLTSTVRLEVTQPLSKERIVSEIEGLGYSVELPSAHSAAHEGQDNHDHSHHDSTLTKKFIFCLLWTIPLTLHMFINWHVLHNGWVQAALCLPVFIVGLTHFGKSGLNSLKSGTPNMDVLIVIGIIAAFAYSMIGTILGLGPDFLFFETSATITTIVLFGNLLEERSVQKTTSSIGELAKMQASVAQRIVADGDGESTEAVRVEELRVGDVVRVNNGDRVPTDGKIIWGNASLDESMLSGESLPVDKEVGQTVIGGTTLVSGSIKIAITNVGTDSVLAQMISLVKEAQLKKPRLQRIGDQVSAIFVPTVLAIALLAFLLSYFAFAVPFSRALLSCIAVLVVACPCALGLATPTAIMVGIGEAARRGILIKGGDTLETLAKVKTIVFDKTGTLTTGKFKLQELKVFSGQESYVRQVILGLVSHSSHPISQSLAHELKEAEAYSLLSVTEEKGAGLTGVDSEGAQFRLGSTRILNESDRNNRALLDTYVLFLTKNGVLMAALNLTDEVKSHAAEALSKIRALGITTVMLSGDRANKCSETAKALSIGEVYAEKLPSEKLSIITDMSKQTTLAYVGDGVNDAAALAAANVGISLSNASASAINSAQVVLLNGELDILVRALSIARTTYLTMQQNLFWAFFYNVLAIPAAASGYLSPTIAAFSMAFSDVIVVANSLRLRIRGFSK